MTNTPAVPQFQVLQHTLTPLAEGFQQHVYVVSVDLGLVRLTVPSGISTWTLERALLTWLGRQRCLGVRLHQVTLQGTAPIYCLPRRGRSTLAVALVDLADSVMDPVIHVLDGDGPHELDCEVLREPWRPASLFWNEVLSRGPACVACWSASTSAPHGGPPVRHVTLGLDVCRAPALGTGWRAPIFSQIPKYDLVQRAVRQGITWSASRAAGIGQDASTQTVASHWPMHAASPLFSAAMPVPRRADGCSFNSRYGSEGTLFHLECPQMHVRCTIPCVTGRHIWALRLGNWVHAACTSQLGWDEVLEVAGLSLWDLPGTSIHGPDQVWTWPDDVLTLSGQCGHVMHEGSDPCLECLDFNDGASPASGPPGLPSRSAASRCSSPIGFALLLAVPDWHLRILVAASFMFPGSSSAEADSDSGDRLELNSSGGPDEVEDDMHPPHGDPTRTCTVAWCHELSCQSTHFSVSPLALAEYINSHAPVETVRVQLWLPFQGPALFDFARGSTASVLEAKLAAAGHDPRHYALIVAYDTQATVVDLLAIPPGGSKWWIVRDGLSRELLRPVTTWVDDHRRAVVTINSHGQVVSLAATPEVAGMYQLPHGARGNVATPLARVYGYLAESGLVLAEASIGVSFATSLLPGRVGFVLALVLGHLPFCHAMMQDQVIITRSQAAWGAPAGLPRRSWVWTHTLAAPVVVPFADPPDPEGMAAAVASTCRGVHSGGLFAWTHPRQWGDAAHVIHYPAGVCPPCVFWLMHYRGRGAVVCATPGPLYWTYLAQEAAESFGSPSFLQGTFGFQHNGRILSFGSDLVAPPHGTILHIVRTGSRPSSSVAANVWDAPADLPWVPQFDYHICRGPRGESPIRSPPATQPQTPAANALREDLQASVSYFQHLLGGLEQSVERCQAVATRLEAQDSHEDVEAGGTNHGYVIADPPAGSSAGNRGPLPSLLFFLCAGFRTSLVGLHVPSCLIGHFVLFPAVWAVESGHSHPDGPSEPSSPDLTDLQAPTPTATIESASDAVAGTVQRPGDTPFARTSAPLSGELAPGLPPFDRAQIPRLQRRVAACVSEVDIREPEHPFIPHGCPFTIHNPFTSRSQCKIMSEVVHTPQVFRSILSDFSARRGWQPLVPVHPQPDEESVHLIPAAASSSLASVLLRTGSVLHPSSLFGTLSLARPSGASGLAPCLPRSDLSPLIALPVARTPGYLPDRPSYQLGNGLEPLLSYESGRPSELVPVWPCLTADRIWFVPRVHISGALKCVVVQYNGQFRAIAIPAELPLARLVQTARFLTGWDLNQIRVPPSLQARARVTEEALLLRDGDLLDAMSQVADAGRYIIRSPSEVKDHVLWSRVMVIQRPMHVRLWSPDLRPPILTCLPAGTLWDPESLTFSGEFMTNFPGGWVPAPWSPCRVPQLVRAADDQDTANVLYEDADGVRCLNIERFATPRDLVEGTQDSGRGTRVLGMLALGTQAPLCLRDGDVVVSGPLRRSEDSAWPDLHDAASRQHDLLWTLSFGGCIAVFSSRLSCLMWFPIAQVLAMMEGDGRFSPDRSRSPDPRPRRSHSPRIGSWQPERRYPMHNVVSCNTCHYQVLCPFRGWGEVQTFSRTDQFAHFLRAVHQDAGTWATSYLPLGGESTEQFTTVLPLPPPPFVTTLLHSAESSRAVVMPAYTTLRQVAEHMSTFATVPGLRLMAPPALRRVEGYLDEPVRLRHGDTFEVSLGAWHPRVRRREALYVPALDCLPHLNVWHVPTQVGTGGWVNVWGTSATGASYCNRFWIADGSIWSPTWLMFSHQGSSVSTRRWVPVPHLPDQDVGFVEQAEVDEAHILLVNPHDIAATRCCRLLLHPDATREAANLLSDGWQLRPDIEARVVQHWPRNGDVFIPKLIGRLFLSGVLPSSLATGGRSLGTRLLLLLATATVTSALEIAPLDEHSESLQWSVSSGGPHVVQQRTFPWGTFLARAAHVGLGQRVGVLALLLLLACLHRPWSNNSCMQSR